MGTKVGTDCILSPLPHIILPIFCAPKIRLSTSKFRKIQTKTHFLNSPHLHHRTKTTFYCGFFVFSHYILWITLRLGTKWVRIIFPPFLPVRPVCFCALLQASLGASFFSLFHQHQEWEFLDIYSVLEFWQFFS